MKEESIRTTCPYCGVGCGLIATRRSDGGVELQGDPDHPANRGHLCSKGAALEQTLDLEGRLLHPVVRGKRADWKQALTAVADGFNAVIREHGPDAVAFYVSGQLLTEDYYVANKLMKGYIGSANIDTNSRLCMSSAVAGHKRAFGSDTVPGCYEDLERAKLIVFAGSNAAWCHPVLYQRIVRARRENPDLQVVVIDPRRTPTCDIADLHLPLRPGSDAILFNGLLVHLERQGERNDLFLEHCTEGFREALNVAEATAPTIESVAARCGLEEQAVAEFYRLFARTERTVTLYSQGINQSSSGTDKVNAILNCHLFTGRIGRPGMGPFSLTGQPNAMGGREVGGLANQLAAHMELTVPEHRELVQRFWDSPRMAEKPGALAMDMFRRIERGHIKALWVMATNPAVSLPDGERIRTAMRKCPLVVVSDCMADTDTARLAHILLPAAAWGEKDGTVTNSERRISRQRRFLPLPGAARPDWWIICEVAKRMGFHNGFDYTGSADIFREHAALSGYGNSGERDFDISGLAALSDAEYDRLEPLQWPVPRPGEGTPRMFSRGRFFTASGKARLVPVEPRLPRNIPDQDYTLVLNTGRLRDQWHTMTRTGKAPRLTEHSPEPTATLHPEDAGELGIADGVLVNLSSRWGEVIVRARISTEQRRGSVFVPIHWSDRFASSGRIDAVVNPDTDPLSGQPEFKHTPVRVIVYEPAWHGFLLSRRRPDLSAASYWVMAKGEGYYHCELAGEQPETDWPAWARKLLCSDDDADWVEYLDRGHHRYRGVRMVGDRLESCIFIGPDHELPARSWLASLFSRERLSATERKGLLAGRPPAGEKEAGHIVCACFSVGVNTLTEAIRTHRLTSVEAIGERLKAGTGCGSCVPELRGLLAEAALQKPVR